MTNKKYNGKIYICKSCGRVHECDIRCPSCFGGNGHQNVIADTNDKQQIAELEKQNAELRAENERMRCCENCGNHSGYCGLSFSRMCVCKCYNLKHWKRKESK